MGLVLIFEGNLWMVYRYVWGSTYFITPSLLEMDHIYLKLFGGTKPLKDPRCMERTNGQFLRSIHERGALFPVSFDFRSRCHITNRTNNDTMQYILHPPSCLQVAGSQHVRDELMNLQQSVASGGESQS